MSRYMIVISLIVILLVATSVSAETRGQAKLVKIGDLNKTELRATELTVG